MQTAPMPASNVPHSSNYPHNTDTFPASPDLPLKVKVLGIDLDTAQALTVCSTRRWYQLYSRSAAVGAGRPLRSFSPPHAIHNLLIGLGGDMLY